MERTDLPTLRALGFEDDELKELNLWTPATGEPGLLADIYLRRSKKKDTLTSLREQVRVMCQQAKSDGVRIRHVWFEQRSASKSYVRREEFEKATAAVTEHGLSKTLYVFKTSRLSRRGMGQVGLLLDKLEERQARIYVVAERLDSRYARMILAILSEQAREQANDISQFTKLGIKANKAEGKWGGGVAPYGLYAPKESGKLAHNPAEYPTARRIAEYLLKGRTPNWIANELNNDPEAPKTRHGKRWNATGIIALAHSVSWAGLVPQRELIKDKHGNTTDKYHRGGTPLLDKEGHPVSVGQGVITFAEHMRIKAILAERAQPGTSIGDRTRGKREIVSLMTDTLKCPYCKGRMSNGGPNYRCYARQQMGPSGCQGIATNRDRLDAAVTMAWHHHILSLSPESDTLHEIARRWLRYNDPEKEARKAQVLAALENAVGRELKLQKEFFVIGGMDETRYETMRADLTVQIASMKRGLAQLSKTADLSPLMEPESLAVLWEGAGISGQRALLKAALKSATVSPPRYRGDRAPIETRLTLVWRESETRSDEAGRSYVEQCRR